MEGSRPLVIGFGSALRGDDAAGPRAALLVRDADPGGRWQVIACHQLTPELAEQIAQASVVVFLDADAAVTPGEVAASRLGPQSATGASPVDLHQLTPGALLRLAEQVYGTRPLAWLAGLGVESFDLADGLTPAAEAAARKAAAFVLALPH